MVSVVRFSRKLFQGAIFSNVLFGELAVPVQLRQKERRKEKKQKNKTGRHILVKQEAAAESCCRCLPAAIFFSRCFTRIAGRVLYPLYMHTWNPD